MRYSVVWYGIGGLMLGAIVIGSLVPVPTMKAAPNDKLIHFLIYFLLMAWLGLLLELAQGQTRYRTFEWYDVGANSAGVLVAWLVVMTPLGKTLQRVDQWLQTVRA
jgi:glycopeptide antibiotics resistance protein